jgi:hypothetical protein
MVFFCLTPTLSDLLTEKAKENRVDRAAIEQLVGQLGDRDFARREEAGRALRERGAGILSMLAKARGQAEPEVRRRLDDLIESMQTTRILEPRLISLPKQATARQYAAMIGAQSGYPIASDALDAKQLLEMDCSRMRYWEALDRFCDLAGIAFSQTGDETIRLVTQNVDSPYRSYDGIFRVTALGFNYSRSTHFAQLPKNTQLANPSNEMLNLNLMVQVEPRTSILRIGRPRVLVALDDEKRSMSPSADAQFPENGGIYYGNAYYRSRALQVNTALILPGKNAQFVSRIKGTIPVTLLAEQKPILVTDKLMESKGKKFKVGTATITIDDIESSNGPNKRPVFKLTYASNATETRVDYSRLQTIQQQLELRDARGNKIEINSNLTQFNGPTSAQFTIGLQGNSNKNTPVPAQLVFIDWIQLEHDVTFELKDLPLP